MKRFNSLFLVAMVCLSSFETWAQAGRPRYTRTPREEAPVYRESTFRYDISAGSGRYNDESYTEITGGLNWGFSEWWTWRNAIFHRFGSNTTSVTGLDSSLRLGNSFSTPSGMLGMDFYVGPGYRFANADNSAVFGEGGLGFKMAGIYLGVGVKSLYYTKTRQDTLGRDLPKSDQMVFIVLAGGGSF